MYSVTACSRMNYFNGDCYMNERRSCERVDVNIPATVIINGHEFSGTVKDVSAKGLYFLLDKPDDLENCDKISFSFYDKGDFLEIDKFYFSGEGIVNRLESSGFACILSEWNNKLYSYLENKKISRFLKTI